MTPTEYENEVGRLRTWWSVGLRPWANVELFSEFFMVSVEDFRRATEFFIDEGRETCPPPSVLWKKVRELAPPVLVSIDGPCDHDRHPYPFLFETPRPGQAVLVVECRFCGELLRRVPSQVRTPGQDIDDRFERRPAYG